MNFSRRYFLILKIKTVLVLNQTVRFFAELDSFLQNPQASLQPQGVFLPRSAGLGQRGRGDSKGRAGAASSIPPRS